MTAPGHVHDQAAGIASLPADDPDRVAAEAHAAACPSCAAALKDAEAMFALLDALPPPERPSSAALARTKAAVLAAPDWPDTAPVSPAKAPALGVAITFLVLALAAKHRSGDGRVWMEAGAAAALAVGATASSRHRARLSLAVVSLASVALVASAGGPWTGAPALAGAKCVVFELLASAVPLGFVVHGVLRRRHVAGRVESAAFAGAGALAGQAALHVSCPDHASSPHLLPFHLGGVLLAAGVGAMLAVFLEGRVTATS